MWSLPGIHTKVAQVVAMSLGCPLELIRVADTNSEVPGWGGKDRKAGTKRGTWGQGLSSGYIVIYRDL